MSVCSMQVIVLDPEALLPFLFSTLSSTFSKQFVCSLCPEHTFWVFDLQFLLTSYPHLVCLLLVLPANLLFLLEGLIQFHSSVKPSMKLLWASYLSFLQTYVITNSWLYSVNWLHLLLSIAFYLFTFHTVSPLWLYVLEKKNIHIFYSF